MEQNFAWKQSAVRSQTHCLLFLTEQDLTGKGGWYFNSRWLPVGIFKSQNLLELLRFRDAVPFVAMTPFFFGWFFGSAFCFDATPLVVAPFFPFSWTNRKDTIQMTLQIDVSNAYKLYTYKTVPTCSSIKIKNISKKNVSLLFMPQVFYLDCTQYHKSYKHFYYFINFPTLDYCNLVITLF